MTSAVTRARRVALVAAVVLGTAAILWWGMRPGLRMPAGDFANYYTSAYVASTGEDLTPAYTDFLWFQKRVDAAGLAGQFGAFIPHPPATALVILPLVALDPLRAKQVWTFVNLVVALACVVALARLSGLGWTGSALALLGTGTALANDLAFGQMYLPLLLSLALGLLLVERGSGFWGGVAIGAMLPIKPFAAPLVLYFAVRREWRTVAGVAASAGAITIASLAVVGWHLHAEYLAVVLPHQLDGRLQDPFHPLWQSWQSLSRRMFLSEPTLNPAPALDAPRLAAVVPALASASGWAAVALACSAAPGARRLHYAALVLAALALAPGGATYHLVLVALPLALLASELGRASRDETLLAAVVGCAVPLALPLAAWARRFDGGWTTPLAYPRLWLLAGLLALTVVALVRRRERPPSRRLAASLAAVVLALGAVAALRVAPRAWDEATPVAVTAPELSGPDRTVMAQPEMEGSRLVFVAANPASGSYDLFAPDRRIGPSPFDEQRGAALSPDRRRLAFVAVRDGNQDIWLRDLATGAERRLTSDSARDRDPCWEDGSTIVFASDRGRGLGYTALYRVTVMP